MIYASGWTLRTLSGRFSPLYAPLTSSVRHTVGSNGSEEPATDLADAADVVAEYAAVRPAIRVGHASQNSPIQTRLYNKQRNSRYS